LGLPLGSILFDTGDMKYVFYFLLWAYCLSGATAQQADTTDRDQLPDIIVTAFEQQKSRLGVASSLVAVSMTDLDRSNKISLVSGLNS
jgi:hypothetical protein